MVKKTASLANPSDSEPSLSMLNTTTSNSIIEKINDPQ